MNIEKLGAAITPLLERGLCQYDAPDYGDYREAT
jgi:hypothetical protein